MKPLSRAVFFSFMFVAVQKANATPLADSFKKDFFGAFEKLGKSVLHDPIMKQYEKTHPEKAD